MNLPETQNNIIARLKNADILRYRDLKPQDTPNDLFNYHLQSLVTKGTVAKTLNGYTLSESGKAYVADTYHTSDPRLNRLFKVNVITIVSRINNGAIEILTQRRNSQPSHGLVDVMGGTIVKGEDLLEGASRKLHDETGLTAKFKLLGFEKRRVYKGADLFSDIIFPICYADNYEGDLICTAYGENFWVPIDEAIKNADRTTDNIVSIVSCLVAIKTGKLTAASLFYNETTQSI